GQERSGRAGQRLGRLPDVDLVQLRRVDPELLAVGDDLLLRRLTVFPAQLAALLEIDRTLRGDRGVEALVERRLTELGLEIGHPPIRGLHATDDLVERRGGGERGAHHRQDDGQRNGGQGGSPSWDTYWDIYMDAGHALTVQHGPWIRRLLPREPPAT